MCFLRLHSHSKSALLSSAGVSITSSGTSSPDKPSWATSLGFPGALKVSFFKGFEMYQRRRGNSRSTGCFQFQSGMEPEHIVETVVSMSFCLFTHPKVNHHRHCTAARAGTLPIRTLSTPLHDSSPCLVNCTVARSLHEMSTFVACALRQKAR